MFGYTRNTVEKLIDIINKHTERFILCQEMIDKHTEAINKLNQNQNKLIEELEKVKDKIHSLPKKGKK